MIIVPAIDLAKGRCVRLAQGDFARETVYSDDPAAALASFVQAGAEEVHVVDLDGAKAGYPVQHDVFAALARSNSARIQVAGGFRSAKHVEAVLSRGVHRVVLGSLALANPGIFLRMLREFGAEHLGVALDVRVHGNSAKVATHGWVRSSGEELFDVLKSLHGVRHVLVTDISRDGMLNGPNVELMTKITERFPGIELQASGGVSQIGDVATLRKTGAARAIVGKAIWEGRVDVAEAVAHACG